MSGRLRFATPDGLEMEVGPGMVFEVQPGHDAWVLGQEACVIYDFAGMRTFGLVPSPEPPSTSAMFSTVSTRRHHGSTPP